MGRRSAQGWGGGGWQALPRPLALGVVLAATLASAADVRYNVGGIVNTRVRSSLAGDLSTAAGAAATYEIELIPTAEVGLGFEPTLLSLRYNPSILFREIERLGPVVVLHNGRLAVGTRWEGGSFTFTEDASYGETDMNPLRNEPGATPTTTTVTNPQSVGVIPYARSATAASVSFAFPHQVGLTLTAGYQLGGSLATDGGVQLADPVTAPLPFQYGPTGLVGVRVAATELDTVAATAQVSQATFSTGEEQLIALATVTWDRRLTRSLSSSLLAGGALTRQRVCTVFELKNFCDPDALPANWDTTLVTPGWYMAILPAFSASGTWSGAANGGAPLAVTALARVTPFADRVTGAVYSRFEANLTALWSPTKTIAVRGVASVGYALHLSGVDTQGGDQVYMGEGTFTWTPEPWVSLAALLRVAWVHQPRLQVPGYLDWAAALSAVFRLQGTVGW